MQNVKTVEHVFDGRNWTAGIHCRTFVQRDQRNKNQKKFGNWGSISDKIAGQLTVLVHLENFQAKIFSFGILMVLITSSSYWSKLSLNTAELGLWGVRYQKENQWGLNSKRFYRDKIVNLDVNGLISTGTNSEILVLGEQKTNAKSMTHSVLQDTNATQSSRDGGFLMLIDQETVKRDTSGCDAAGRGGARWVDHRKKFSLKGIFGIAVFSDLDTGSKFGV